MTTPSPPDIRVEKETSLLKANYNIFIATRRKKEQKHLEAFKGIYILRINLPAKIRMPSYFIDRLRLFLKLMFTISSYNIIILHVHDLPYALLVTILGKAFRRKVVFDMHEHYVSLAEQRLKEKAGLQFALSKLWISYLRLSEFLACKLATKVVVKENAERLIRLGIPQTKIVIVSNTADLKRLRKLDKKIRRKFLQNKFIVSYVGGFSPHRGLDTLIKALPKMIKKVPNIHVLLVGNTSPALRKSLKNLCKELGVEGYVTFTGWVTFNKATEYMQVSDLGIIPYHSTPQTNATIPHKIFQYMYFRKPVLATDVKPLKRIVEETRSGLVFRASDHTQLADKIIKIMENPKLMKEMGERGRKAVENKYNWNVEGTKLLELYSEISNRNTSAHNNNIERLTTVS